MRGRAGRVKNVVYMDADVEYQWRTLPNPLGVHHTSVSNIVVRNVRAEVADRVVWIKGNAAKPFQGVRLEGVSAGRVEKFASRPVVVENADVSMPGM